MWDGGWGDGPAGPAPARPPSPIPAAPRDAALGGWPADDGPAPARWYAPSTRRGKIILMVVVLAVLIATLVGCLGGVDGLRELKSMDLFDLI